MKNNVFLVDDEPGVRDALSWMLEAAGISLVTFPSAEAFLQQVDIRQPGCILLDICMPNMSGVELQEQLLTDDNVMSIIFLTGQADIPTTSKVFKNGAFDLLEKPVEAKILIDTIHNALALSEHRAQYQQKNQTLRTKFSRLTVREKQILHLVLAGYTNKMIGDKLYLALRTVEIHRHNMMKKMDSDSPVQLAQQLSRYPEFNELFLIP